MSKPIQLVLEHLFGLRLGVKSNVLHIDDTLIVYPAGSQIVLYNAETRSQRFIHGLNGSNEDDSSIVLAVSPKDHKYVAVAEASARATVTVYNANTLKRVRTPIQSAECASSKFISVCFSPDQRHILAMGGEPDYMLTNWLWEKKRLLQSIKLGSFDSNVSAVDAAYCPTDPSLVAVVGPNMLSLFRIEPSEFKPLSVSFKERKCMQKLRCMAWDNARLLIGSEDGNIHIIEGTEHRSTCSMPQETISVHSIQSFNKGFVCGCNEGVVYVFERVDEKDQDETQRELYRAYKMFRVEGTLNRVMSLSVSPSGESLAITLDNAQAYTLNLSQIDILKEEEMMFEPLAQGFHSDAVVDIDVCLRKPLVASCSLDQSVRIWNYEERLCELVTEFDEVPLSVAFHPSGLHLLVGFSHQVVFMNVLMDDFRSFKEFSIKDCRTSAFSKGGQFFAAVTGNSIEVYETYTSAKLRNLQGHSAKVRAIDWSSDDEILVSTGVDGTVIEWSMPAGTHHVDFEDRDCNFSSAIVTANHHIYALGNESMLREINDGVCLASVELNTKVDHLAQVDFLGRQVIIGAGADGNVRSLGTSPCKETNTNEEGSFLSVHSSAISALRAAPDSNILITAGEDGCIAVMSVADANSLAGSSKKEAKREMAWAEEILVSRSDLHERISHMNKLSDQVDELITHNQYQMRLKEMNYHDRIRGLHDKYNNEIKADQQKYTMLQNDKDTLNAQYQKRIEELRIRETKELSELEIYHAKKIVVETERRQELQDLLDLQRKSRKKNLDHCVISNINELQELEETYLANIEEEKQLTLRTEAEKNAIVKEFEQTKNMLEEDADQEIDDLKKAYDIKLSAERKLTLHLGSNNGVLKAKFSKMQSTIANQKEQIEKMVAEERKLYDTIRGFEKDIDGYQKEISERDSTIADKDKRIGDLRKKNQELEKFKFVLDYKIRELNRQIQPRELEIERKKQQLSEMNAEVNKYKAQFSALNLNVKQLHLKLEGMNSELAKQTKRHDELKRRAHRFCHDVQFLALSLNEPKRLKKGVILLYKQYGRDTQNSVDDVDGDNRSDVTKEYHRHRVYLEKSVDSLKQKLVKDAQSHKKDNARIMQENILLIAEINDLRRDIRYAKQILPHGELSNVITDNDKASADEIVASQNTEIEALQKQVAKLAGKQHSSSVLSSHV